MTYQYMEIKIKELEKRIEALEQEPSETTHGSTYGGVSWGGTYKPQQYSALLSTRNIVNVDIEDLPPVTSQPNQRWIPVSERLPDKNDVYLVTMNVLGKPIRDIDRFRIDEGWGIYENNEDNKVIEVIAWMPLPEPYKAERSSEE